MRKLQEIPESKLLHIPDDVWSARAGESGPAWSERWLDFFRSRDFARGKTVYAPDGSVFFAPNGENSRAIVHVFERTHAVREWEAAHPGR